MREGNIFSLFTLAGGGVVPIPGLDGRGYPNPDLDREVPHPADGGYPIPGLDRGVPHPRSGPGGIPCQIWMGGMPSQVSTRSTPSC